MNILFLTLVPTHSIASRGIYNDLMREFVRRGHTPYIVCPIERRFRQPEQVIQSDGAHILQVRTLNIQKTNLIEKGIGTLLLEHQFMNAIKRHWSDLRFQLCIYSTPPITFNKIIAWQKSLGVPTYLLLKDIFPQNAVDLQMFSRHSPFYWLFRRKETRLYALSDRIGCMSPANCRFVITHNPKVNPGKVHVCPNSIELHTEVTQTAKDKTILHKYGIPADRPLFIYGGNIGKPQGIDFLIQILDELKERTDLHICIAGDGTESHKLHNWYASVKPKAVTVMNLLPKADYDLLVAAADVGMIFLDHRFTIPNFPSRLLSYLECRQPVFLATDRNTDIGTIAGDNHFGMWCESGDMNVAIAQINSLAADPGLREEMGENGYRFLKENYTVDKTADIILNGL